MKKSRHIRKLYRKLAYSDGSTWGNYIALHAPYEIVRLYTDMRLQGTYKGSATYLRLGTLLPKLVAYYVLRLDVQNLVESFDMLFSRINDKEKLLKDVKVIRSKEWKYFRGDAYLPKDLNIEKIAEVYNTIRYRIRKEILNRRQYLKYYNTNIKLEKERKRKQHVKNKTDIIPNR